MPGGRTEVRAWLGNLVEFPGTPKDTSEREVSKMPCLPRKTGTVRYLGYPGYRTKREEIAADAFLPAPGRILPSGPMVEHLFAQGMAARLRAAMVTKAASTLSPVAASVNTNSARAAMRARSVGPACANQATVLLPPTSIPRMNGFTYSVSPEDTRILGPLGPGFWPLPLVRSVARLGTPPTRFWDP